MNLRKLADGLSCVRCHQSDGTVVLAHYTGPRQHAFGKGMGIKGHDTAAAHLCSVCHSRFDSYADGNTVERSEEFLFLCCLTMIRVWEHVMNDEPLS